MKNRIDNITCKNNNKRGISLIVLIITIVAAIILISAVTIATASAIDNTHVTTFAKNLTEIQEATESYYIINNVMPVITGSAVMDKNDLFAISRNPEILTEELTENNDLDLEFYVIDLAKINIKNIGYGNKTYGEDDIFVVSYPSMNAYYPYGIEAKGTIYFSITSKISSITKISQNQTDDSVTSVISSGGVTVTKNNGWANKMGVNIDAQMATGEALYMSVSGDTNRLITTTLGTNTFGFDLLSAIVNDTETIKVPTLTMVEANYIEEATKPVEERYVDILKYKDTELIGKVRINLSNFSKNAPTVTSATLTSYSSMNTVNLLLASSESGIREVRYEYLTKYTEQGTIVYYYENFTDFDLTYMQSRAKKAKLENNLATTISAPKNVKSIKVAIIDKAGNVNSYVQDIAPSLFIGYTMDNDTQDVLQITANMYSINGIKTVTFSESVDGLTYTNDQIFTLNTTTSGVTTQQSSPFISIAPNGIYIKMVAVNYDNTITETRVVRINSTSFASGLGVNTIATKNMTVNGKSPTFSNPIIPKGFKAINDGAVWPTDWNKGLVIEDVSGNQFVWVPVDGAFVPYAKWCTVNLSYTLTLDDTLPSGIVENSQITNYGGFYIARYEAGKEGVDILVSKRNATVWGSISYTNSKARAESMYNTPEVKSGLVTGTQWDTVMEWIKDTGKSVTNSRTWGNHSDSISPANVPGYGERQITGFSENWKTNNIYDIAGNAWEWTNEYYGTNYIFRGSSCYNSGIDLPVSYRGYGPATYEEYNISFRVVLYIL